MSLSHSPVSLPQVLDYPPYSEMGTCKIRNGIPMVVTDYMPDRVDVVVIGGGPAGLMAASVSASGGKDTILLEKTGQPGRKLLISGGGRCNLTNLTDPHISQTLAQIDV